MHILLGKVSALRLRHVGLLIAFSLFLWGKSFVVVRVVALAFLTVAG